MATRYWFKRKRYGWGFTPVTWEGWMAIIVWAAIMLAAGLSVSDVPEETSSREYAFFALFVVLATIGLFQVSLRKGPKPKWRWGKSPGDNPEEDF